MASPHRAATKRRAHEIFDPIAEVYLARDDVDLGRMFGSEGLRIRGRIFAFLGFEGDLVVKVPEQRAGELAASTPAQRMVMKEREMREWLTVAPEHGALWPAFVAEAFAYVDAVTRQG